MHRLRRNRRSAMKAITISSVKGTTDMKRIFCLPLGLAALALLAWSTPLRADSLDVTLDQATLTVPVGTTEVTFTGTISNPSGTDTVFLNSDSSTTSSTLVTVDDTPFLDLIIPLSLDPNGDTGDITLFNVLLDPSTAPGTYTGVYSIQGGADDGTFTDFSDLVDIPFTIDVESAVPTPEPGNLLMLGLGLLAVGLMRRRNRKSGASVTFAR